MFLTSDEEKALPQSSHEKHNKYNLDLFIVLCSCVKIDTSFITGLMCTTVYTDWEKLGMYSTHSGLRI